MNRPLPASWLSSNRCAPALLGTCLGIDLRRPASWITLVMGGCVGWRCAMMPAAGDGIAMLSAAVLAVAAIGDIPLAGCFPAGRGLPFVWGCERVGWPLVGMMLGGLAAGGGPKAGEVMPVAVVGAVLAAVTTFVCRRSGVKAADAASFTLLVASASAVAGGELAPRLGGTCVAVVVVWLLLGGLGRAWSRSHRTAMDTLLPGPHRGGFFAGADVLHVDVLPANGLLRQTLTRLAMVASLAAMAGWLMIEPEIDAASGDGHGHFVQAAHRDRLMTLQHAAMAWALFTAAWFVGLAVPQATLQDGVAGATRWERLFRTAARGGHGGEVRRLGGWILRAGPARFAGGVALTQATILGWPVLVCAVLALSRPAVAGLPLSIVVGLAAAAVVVWGVVILGTVVHASRETTFASALVIALAVVVVLLAAVADSGFWHRVATSPASPSLPSLAPTPLQRVRGG